MRPFKTSLLVILLSFSVIVQEYCIVSGGVIGLTVAGLGGIALYPTIKGAWKQTGYFFGTFGYMISVKLLKYKKYSTNDDVIAHKYVNIDLASTEHGRYIEIKDQPDDQELRRTKIKLYTVKRDTKDGGELTIGRVNFYCRRLQGSLKHDHRTVLTYLDEMSRKCIQIESFNKTGNRISRRVYRERQCWWWFDRIIDEKETSLNAINPKNWFSSLGGSTTYTLDLNILAVPPCIIKTDFSHGTYYYINDAHKSDLCNITDIKFSNQPITPTAGIDDLLVWHYFKMEDQMSVTSYVVICEASNKVWRCNYHKCVSSTQKEFKLYNSFAIPFDENISLSNNQISPKTPTKIKLDFDLTKKNVPENIDKFTLHLYTESNHYTLRPLELNNVNMLKSISATDGSGTSTIEHSDQINFRFLSVNVCNDEYFLSFTALDSINLLFDTVNMKKESHNREIYFFESNTRALIENMLSPYYMNLEVIGKEIKSEFLDLEIKKKDDVLTAKLNDYITVYTSLYSKYKVIRKLKLESETFDIRFDINSQVFYCETGNSKFVIIVHANGDPTVIKNNNNKFQLGQMNQMQSLISEVKLNEWLNLSFNGSWKGVSLDLDDLYINENIEFLVMSLNTVVFKTPYGKRIEKIVWKNFEVKIEKGWALVSKISYMEHDLLLIDTVFENEVHRELYKVDFKHSKMTLITNKKIAFLLDNLNKLHKELSESMHDLYPNTLPVQVFFEKAKTDISEFDVDSMKIAHSNSDLVFTPGDLKVDDKHYKVLENHKWKQVFKYAGHQGSDFYSIFTLAKKGMFYYYHSRDKQEQKEFLRDPFGEISGSSIPLLIESVYSPGVRTTATNVGKKHITTYSSENNNVLNPIVFGNHEIKLLGSIKKVQVTKSFSEQNLCSISIEAVFQDDKKGTLTFTQDKENSEQYSQNGDASISYVDDSIDIVELVKDQSSQDVLDFNKQLYPLNLRYMILNENYYYFTGFTRIVPFKIIFGDETREISIRNTRYNIWIRYTYEAVTTCTLFMSYKEGDKLKTISHVHDNHGSQNKIDRPNVKFNWGILSNLEALVVNRNLLSMVGHKEEFFPVDLKIDDTSMEKVIMKLKIDDNTSVYTTVSNTKCVINNVKYKNVIIKGTPKQIAKQVFFSKVDNEVVIVIATKTVNKVLVNPYVLKDNSFEMVRISDIKFTHHKGLEFLKMRR